MGNNIKGITIEIGGNTGPLTTALKDVNKTAGDLQSELKQVNRQLKFDPKNVDLLRQKEELTSQATQALREKQDILKQAVEQAHQQFEKGDLGADKVRAVEREYAKVSSQIKDLESQHKSFFSKVAEKLKITKENLKTAIGAIGMTAGAFLKDTISSATNAQKSTSQLTNLLQNQGITAGEAKKDIDSFTSGITKMSSFSVGEAKEALQTLTEKGISAGDTLKMEGTLANIAAGQNISLGEAANTLADAYHGKTKALISLGIVTKDEVTNSNKAQKAEELQGQIEQNIAEKYGKSATATKLLADMYNHKTDALITAGVATKAEAKTLDNSSKSALNMTEIQDRLNKRFGGAAQADLNTYSGRMKEMQNTLNNAKAQIGTALLPILAQLVKIISDLLKPIANFISQHPKITAGILSIVAAIGTLIGSASVVNTLAAALGPLGAAITGTEVAASSLVVPILAVTAAIAGIAVLATFVITNWSGFKAFFAGVWSSIKSGVSGIGVSIKNAFLGAVNGVKSAWNGVTRFFTNIGNGIKSGVLGAVNGLKTGISALGSNIIAIAKNIWKSITNFFVQSIPQFIAAVGQWFQKLPYNIGYALGTAVKAVINFGKSVWNWVTVQLPQIINSIINWFAQLPDRIWNFLIQAVTNMGKWGTNMWNYLSVEIPKIINAIGTWFAQLPGRIWTWLVNTIEKIGTWGSNMYSAAASAVNRTINAIGTWFAQLPGRIWTWLLQTVRNIGTWGNNMNREASSAVHTLITNIINWFKNLPGEMLKIGENIVHGIWNGITGAGSWLWGKVTGWCNNLVKGFKDALGIHSPSRLFADVIGKNLALGIGQGFSKNMESVIPDMASVIPKNFTIGTNFNPVMTGNDSGQQDSKGKNDSQQRKVEQHINVQNMNVQGKGDEERTLQQLQFIAQI